MDVGALTSGLLIGLREGVEAALIVAIVLAYLNKVGGRAHFGKVWLGVGAAIALSTLLGVLLFVTVGGLQEPYEQLFEAATMALAAGVVTWMLFWMRRQAASVSGELRAAVDRALADGSAWALSALAFVAIIREGLETSLFIVGTAQAAGTADDAGSLSLVAGAILGLLIAAGIGVGLYRGSRRVNLRTFFRATGVLLVFVAAGLVSHAVAELVEVGVITIGTQTLFDIEGLLSQSSVIGQLLRALFGYSSAPEAITFATWLAYIAIVLPLFLRPLPPPPAKAPARVPAA